MNDWPGSMRIKRGGGTSIIRREVIELIKAGWSDQEIVDELGCHKTLVERIRLKRIRERRGK